MSIRPLFSTSLSYPYHGVKAYQENTNFLSLLLDSRVLEQDKYILDSTTSYLLIESTGETSHAYSRATL